MFLDVGIAIVGSHRLETSRHAASGARHFGRYHLNERLGHGDIAEVYLAEHSMIRRHCAVKLIRP